MKALSFALCLLLCQLASSYALSIRNPFARVSVKPQEVQEPRAQVIQLLEPNAPAGIQVAARQSLFNYATQEALTILQAKVQELHIPDATKSFNIPIVGTFELQLSNLKVTNFTCAADEAQLQILEGFFHLKASDVEARLTFDWHWQKAGLSGTGDGELWLHGGTIDYVFDVHTDADLKKPQLTVVTASTNFDAVELKIHSLSADWLYQAVLTIFNDAVRRQVQNGIQGALADDVPKQINKILASLPTRLEIKGLPFSVTFQYSIYTTTYVLVKGYGEVEADSARMLADAVQCPFETTALPLTGDQISQDPHMNSLYVHETTVNCILWGLYRTNKLKFSLVEGAIPSLHITTDLLAMLIPDLPKTYPHQFMIIDIQALANPIISFAAETGTTIQALYRTSISVANETLGNPHIGTLDANLTVTGLFDWNSIQITAAHVQHTVVDSTMNVPANNWDMTVGWFIQNYGSLYSLKQILEMVVHTPVTSMVNLQNAAAVTYDKWYSLSSDVLVHNIPGVRIDADSQMVS